MLLQVPVIFIGIGSSSPGLISIFVVLLNNLIEVGDAFALV